VVAFVVAAATALGTQALSMLVLPRTAWRAKHPGDRSESQADESVNEVKARARVPEPAHAGSSAVPTIARAVHRQEVLWW
jgi:hypothetical protein